MKRTLCLMCLFVLLQTAFIVSKLFGVIDLDWWLILLPSIVLGLIMAIRKTIWRLGFPFQYHV